VSAAPALVSSAGQLQYVMKGCFSPFNRLAEASMVSNGIRIAPGM
jgi:hypothetical protein